MDGAPGVTELQAQLAERERELARLAAELAAWDVTERQRVEEQLRHSEEQARDLIRYAPSGIYEVDFRTGRFRSINDAMCEILGYSREELLAMTAFDLLDDEGKGIFADRIRRTLAGEKVDPSVEYRVKKRDGGVIYGVLSTRITYSNGQPDGAFVIAHDVTERRRAAEELAEQRERLGRLAAEREAILAAIADGLVVLDAEGRILRLNAAAEQMLGLSRAQRDLPVQERLVSLLRPLKPDGSPCRLDEFPAIRALKGEVVTNRELILHVPARAGGPLRMVISSAPILGPDGKVAGAVSTFGDTEAFYAISDELRQANRRLQAQAAELAETADRLREAQGVLEQRVQERTAELAASREELRTYARRLAEVIESERRSLARELHDQAGQSMSALKLSLGYLRREAKGSGQDTARLEEIEQLVDSVMDDLHRLTVNLRPASLDRYGLVPALQQYTDFYRQQSGLDVDLVIVGVEEQRLPPDVETAIYRVIQEALTNVVRHARATRVAVMLHRRGERVVAIVEDDGQGFDHAAALHCGRLGLVGMRERAEMLGGSLTIESAPGKGTTVYVDLPCLPPAASA